MDAVLKVFPNLKGMTSSVNTFSGRIPLSHNVRGEAPIIDIVSLTPSIEVLWDDGTILAWDTGEIVGWG